ncbi:MULTISPECIES: OmpP1/FadL family transporter [Cysteiniphilum]|uniref:Long-chain fatty acid transporter n=1 Tax=Cysteiniphilum litorale TaxID=2056700 RepID=A0A8J3EA59_9GAMM|nr:MULTISPECIES: OmpP1/FadL family transporter [Cysteiniphilum]GGG06668.1 long-chain fatty acid transporter [Cysteiniphilum litorale]
MLKNIIYKATALSLVALSPYASFASAYQIFEQDAASLGTYHAGSAAQANDASTQWYNPAGMVNLKSQQISVGGELVNTNIRFTGTQQNVGQMASGNPEPVNGVNGGGLTPVPNIHYVLPFDRWAFGIGIVAPFGAETDYGDSSPLKYSGTKTQLQVIDITPAIAFKVNKYLSLGIGADIAYVTGEFDNAFAYVNQSFQPVDINVKNKGDAFTFGFHTGVLVNFNESNRIGLTYHSKMTADLKGSTTMSGDTSGVVLNPQTPYTSGDNFSTEIVLPAWWDLAYYIKATSDLALMASASYTQWDSVNNVTLKNVVTPFGTQNFQDVIIQQDFSNTWNFAIGATYDLTPKWILKAGAGYDMTPTNDQYRNIQIPDQSRFILATGVEYRVLKSLSIALSYAHFFVQRASIDNTQNITDTYQTTKGYVQSSADLLGLQLKWII